MRRWATTVSARAGWVAVVLASAAPVSADPLSDVEDTAAVFDGAERPRASGDPRAASRSRNRIAIYYGFERSELPKSVRATLEAATACVDRGSLLDEPRVEATTAGYLSATEVDGQPVNLELRVADWRCNAEPVHACSFTYVHDPELPALLFATVQCTGSHDKRTDMFLVTAARDLDKAKTTRRGKRKGTDKVSLTFQTTSFPGTHLTAYTARRREDGKVTAPVAVSRFDDYAETDEGGGVTLATGQLFDLAQEVRLAVCAGTVAGGCARSRAGASESGAGVGPNGSGVGDGEAGVEQ